MKYACICHFFLVILHAKLLSEKRIPVNTTAIPYNQPMRRLRRPTISWDSIYPKWLSNYGIVVYILALVAVSVIYSRYSLPWYYMLSGVVGVLAFFAYGRQAAKDTSIFKIRRDKTFEQRIFMIAFVPRLLFVILLYHIFQENYGNAFGFENADATYYNELGAFVANLIDKGNFKFYSAISSWSGSDDISDMGYGVYLGFVYWISDNSIIFARLL